MCVRRHDHHEAVEKDGGDDDEGEERVDEDVDGHAAHRAERGEHPQRVLRAEPEDVLALADDDEGLCGSSGGKKHNEGGRRDKLTRHIIC